MSACMIFLGLKWSLNHITSYFLDHLTSNLITFNSHEILMILILSSLVRLPSLNFPSKTLLTFYKRKTFANHILNVSKSFGCLKKIWKSFSSIRKGRISSYSSWCNNCRSVLYFGLIFYILHLLYLIWASFIASKHLKNLQFIHEFPRICSRLFLELLFQSIFFPNGLLLQNFHCTKWFGLSMRGSYPS